MKTQLWTSLVLVIGTTFVQGTASWINFSFRSGWGSPKVRSPLYQLCNHFHWMSSRGCSFLFPSCLTAGEMLLYGTFLPQYHCSLYCGCLWRDWSNANRTVRWHHLFNRRCPLAIFPRVVGESRSKHEPHYHRIRPPSPNIKKSIVSISRQSYRRQPHFSHSADNYIRGDWLSNWRGSSVECTSHRTNYARNWTRNVPLIMEVY